MSRHQFEWRREECYLDRKPDPQVLVAITKDQPGRLKTTSVQILDYNLNRFDIDDRKGLEIVLLTALLTFQDSNDTYHTPAAPESSIISRVTASLPGATPPVPPPKPEPKTGLALIKEIHSQQGVYNEIDITEEGAVEDYGVLCAEMLAVGTFRLFKTSIKISTGRGNTLCNASVQRG